jgi:hypothetical protein
MVAGVEPAAGLALTAGAQFGRNRLAQQKCGKLFGEGRLADASGADQENGVRKPGESLPKQLLADCVVPIQLF